jgi:NAD(P)-dependent dehydrogenase (short-subunit alcohol dehydrogenase family)
MKPIKTAVITGISNGVGLALTKKFLSEGYQVVGTIFSGETPGYAHHNLTLVELELTDMESIYEAVKQIQSMTGSIDILVNNAGIAPDIMGSIPNLNDFRNTISTSLIGAISFTEPLIETMKDGGTIIFISSAIQLMEYTDQNWPAYIISKAGINMYAVILSTRLAERDIRVVPVHPGWVRTKPGGKHTPMTPEHSAEKLYKGFQTAESGKFRGLQLPRLDLNLR